MKNLILVLVSVLFIIGCSDKTKNKEGENKKDNPTAQTMNGVEFSQKYKFELPFLDYSEGELSPSSRAAGKKKANAITVSVTEDLIISGSISCTTSPNAQWGGIQKFLGLPLTMDGAISYCNFYWGATQPVPGSMNCPTSIAGVYRGWTSDHDYNIHLSGTLTLE